MRACSNLLTVYLPDKLNGSNNWVFKYVKDRVKNVTQSGGTLCGFVGSCTEAKEGAEKITKCHI